MNRRDANEKRARESVWDYPRPPKVEPTDRHVQVIFAGVTLVDTRRALRVLETSSPPAYYIPTKDIVMEHLRPTLRQTVCEFKGRASYWTVRVGDRTAENAGWSYPQPQAGYEALRDHIAFYAGRMDACLVDGERVRPQPGDYYGGWITSEIDGPFKGEPAGDQRDRAARQ